MRPLPTWMKDQSGAGTVEFVLVLPILLLLSLGIINLCLMMYATSSMHHAVEEAARCKTIKTAVCSDKTSTESYASARYTGPRLTGMSMTYSSTTCGTGVSGNKVVGSGTYSFKTGLRTLSVPISATACYPT